MQFAKKYESVHIATCADGCIGQFLYMKEMAGSYQATPDDVLRAYAHGAAKNLDC